MNSPLWTQRQNLLEELTDIKTQLKELSAAPTKNIQMLNFYHDQLNRVEHLLEMVDDHLKTETDSIRSTKES